jgi:hypothetical protein
MKILMMVMALSGIAVAGEEQCLEVRQASLAGCYHAHDQRRSECTRRCASCSEQAAACVAQCEHYCDAPFYEGCGFDLNGCVARCEHRCHDPDCEDNGGCRAWWCNKDNVKGCVDTCQAQYGALASCRAAWCGEGKAKRACLDGCAANGKRTAACRAAWCGDGAAGRQCFRDTDDSEADCRKQVEAAYKSCSGGAPKK